MNPQPRFGFDLRPLILSVAVVCAACGGSSKPEAPAPPSGGGGSGGEVAVNGTESVGWEQDATSDSEAAGFRYLIYVDDSPRAITDVQCSGSSGTFGCRSRLPQLTNGVHRLEITAARLVDGLYIESPKSAAIIVRMGGGATAPAPSQTSNSAGIPDAGCTALAIGGSDGDVLVLDRSGIRRVPPGVDEQGAVLLEPEPGSPLALSVAAHPAFDANRFVYVLNTSGADASARMQIVRYREAGGVLGERAVLLDRAVDSEYALGRLRFDGAGRLYAGLWGGVHRRGSASAGAVSAPPGILLRLMDDGRVGDDSPDRSGLVRGVEAMRGFDVDASTGRLWILQQTGDRLFSLRTVTVDGAESSEPAPIAAAPSQIAARAATAGGHVSEVWAAFASDPPVSLRRSARGGLAAAARPAAITRPFGDLAFAPSGVLVGCAATDAGSVSRSRVVRLKPAADRNF